LLDTYDEERRPVADRTMAQALARLQAWFKDPSRRLPPPEPIVDDNAVIFGYRYPAGAFAAEAGPADLLEDPRAPSGRSGSRAPHLVVERAGQQVSTIDLFAGKWVLACGPNGGVWSDVVRRNESADTIGVECHAIGPAGELRDVGNRWSAVYGVDQDGAVLIRPDGFVAWRRRDARAGAEAELDGALRRVLMRDEDAKSDAGAKSAKSLTHQGND
jgi:tetracenomycin A2 monooxygenase-dioxygenase